MGDPNTGVVPLMVVGGWGGHNPLSDVWLLDVTNRLWRQVLQCHVCYIHGHVCVNVVSMTQYVECYIVEPLAKIVCWDSLLWGRP